MNVEIKIVKLSAIKLNPDNPRRISTQDMDRLFKSLQDFPEMMKLREIIIDETMTVLGGKNQGGIEEIPEGPAGNMARPSQDRLHRSAVGSYP